MSLGVLGATWDKLVQRVAIVPWLRYIFSMTTQVQFSGEELREARELHGHSQGDLAFNLGCDRKTVGRWEAERHRMSGIYRRQIRVIYPELATARQ